MNLDGTILFTQIQDFRDVQLRRQYVQNKIFTATLRQTSRSLKPTLRNNGAYTDHLFHIHV